MSLSMRTARCEGCRCDWTHPCMIDAATSKPLPKDEVAAIMKGKNPSVVITGCHWDNEYWKQGRAVCSVCSATEGKIPV